MMARVSKVKMTSSYLTQHSACVLVVDDDDVLRMILTRELRKRGFEVFSTGSGAEAIEIYCRAAKQIDLVLMDVNMPVMSGPDTLEAIRIVDPRVRCCFMTADDRPGNHTNLLSYRVAAIFGKPLPSVNELCETLKQIAAVRLDESDSLVEGSAKWRS